MGVVVEVADEKEAGRNERSDHRRAMFKDLSAFDEIVSNSKEHSRDAVQRSVDGRKDAVVDLHWERRTPIRLRSGQAPITKVNGRGHGEILCDLLCRPS